MLTRRKPFQWESTFEWNYRDFSVFNETRLFLPEDYFSDPRNSEMLLKYVKRVYEWGAIAHGFVAHEQDWITKNYFGLPTLVAGGHKVSTGGLRLEQGLPGIYWANLFGSQYVEFFGRDRLYSVPAYYREKLHDGGLLVLTAPSPLDYQQPEVLTVQEAIIDHLGRDAFFERANPTKPCRAPTFTFEQLPYGGLAGPIAYDPIRLVIPDAHKFITEAPKLADQFVQRLKGELDFSAESLRRVDRFVLLRSRGRSQAWIDEPWSQLIREVAAYYGEVLTRELHGQWLVAAGSSDEPHPVIVYAINNEFDVEYVFTRVLKLWLERVREDGLYSRFRFFKSGVSIQLNRLLREQAT